MTLLQSFTVMSTQQEIGTAELELKYVAFFQSSGELKPQHSNWWTEKFTIYMYIYSLKDNWNYRRAKEFVCFLIIFFRTNDWNILKSDIDM